MRGPAEEYKANSDKACQENKCDQKMAAPLRDNPLDACQIGWPLKEVQWRGLYKCSCWVGL